MKEKNDDIKKDEWFYKIDLTVILTIIIGLSYLLSYLHYIVEFNYYNIPLKFLTVGAKEVVFTMFVIISPLMAITWGLMMAFTSKDDDFIESPVFFLSFLKSRKEIKKTLANQEKNLKQFQESIVYMENKMANTEYDTKLLEKEINKQTDHELNKKYENLLNIIKDGKETIDKYKKTQNEARELIKLGHEKLRKVMYEQIRLMLYIVVAILSVLSIVLVLIENEYMLGVFILISSMIIIFGIYFLIKRNNLLMLTFSIIGLLLFYVMGMSFYNTHTKERHIIFEKNEEYYVVLTIYENEFLSAPLDLDTSEIKSNFSFFPINEVENFSKKSIEEIKEQLPDEKDIEDD